MSLQFDPEEVNSIDPDIGNDPCEDCVANGDDYYVGEDGEMYSACVTCPFLDWREDD